MALADEAQAELVAEVERLEGSLSTLLCDLTGGRLSKTNYDIRTMIQAVEEHFYETSDDDATQSGCTCGAWESGHCECPRAVS
jgi:hypothetical protein